MKRLMMKHNFVEYVPAELADGTLYISMEFATVVHLCACGCGYKVVTPLSPAEWQLGFDGETISLTPSIGNWQFPCRSHYWVSSNRVRWAEAWTPAQIEAGRQHDIHAQEQYFAQRSPVPDEQVAPLRPFVRFLRWIMRK